jgi:hypothetical protein
MSRFGDMYDGDGPDYPNAGDLWWSSATSACLPGFARPR